MIRDHGHRADIQLNAALSSATLSQYSTAWKKFKRWLGSYNISDPFTANTHILFLYTSHLIYSSEQKSIGSSTLEMSLAAIGYFFLLAGHNSPTDSTLCSYLVRSANRLLSSKKSACEPITSAELHTVLKFHLTQKCSLKIRMHLTVFLLMFLGLLRFDDAASILVYSDLMQFISCPHSAIIDGVLIFIPRSKTDQGWQGAWIAIGATHTRFCPIKLLQQLLKSGHYCQSHQSQDVGPLLRATKQLYHPERQVLDQITASLSTPIQPLSYHTFLASIQNLVQQAIPGKHIGLHAPRKGGASHMAECDIDSRLVCGLGRWKQGTTFADVYVKMLDGNMKRYFNLTRTLWNF